MSSTTTVSIKTTVTQTPTTDFLNSFIELLSHSYLNTPLTTAFITEIDKTPSSASRSDVITPQRLRKHFTLGVTAATRSNIVVTECNDFQSCALWEPPDFTGTPPANARANPGPILCEWRETARRWKTQYLSMPDTGPHAWDTPALPSQSSGGPSEDPYPADFNKDVDTETRPFWHLAMLAKSKTAEGPEVGACVKPFLEKARVQGVPVWLETSLIGQRQAYERLGCRVVEEVVIGKGRVDENGWPKEGGMGITCWGLIWDSHVDK